MRTERIDFRLTKEEKEKCREFARECRLPMSRFFMLCAKIIMTTPSMLSGQPGPSEGIEKEWLESRLGDIEQKIISLNQVRAPSMSAVTNEQMIVEKVERLIFGLGDKALKCCTIDELTEEIANIAPELRPVLKSQPDQPLSPIEIALSQVAERKAISIGPAGTLEWDPQRFRLMVEEVVR